MRCLKHRKHGCLNSEGGSRDDFCSDTVVGEDLKQQRMSNPTIDQMDLSNSFVESVDCGKDLRNHPSLNDFVSDQVCSIFTINRRDQCIRIFYIPHKAQDVVHVNHLCHLERSGHCPRG